MLLLADVLPGPEFVLPTLVLAPVFVALGVVTARRLRRRGWGRVTALAAGLAVFVALEVAAFVATVAWDESRRRARLDERLREEMAVPPGPLKQDP